MGISEHFCQLPQYPWVDAIQPHRCVCLRGVSGISPYGGFILLLIPVFQLGTGTQRTTALTSKGKEGIKYLSVFFILCDYVSPQIQERMEILLNIPVADVFMVKFQMGFGPSNFLPAKPHNIFVVVLSCPSLLPKDINNFFFIYNFDFFKYLCVFLEKNLVC